MKRLVPTTTLPYLQWTSSMQSASCFTGRLSSRLQMLPLNLGEQTRSSGRFCAGRTVFGRFDEKLLHCCWSHVRLVRQNSATSTNLACE